MLAFGISLVILAVTAVVYAMYVPPVPLVAESRRVAPGTELKRPLERVVERMDAIVDYVLRRRGWNPFPAGSLDLAGIRTPQSTIVTTIAAGTFLGFLLGYLFSGVAVGLISGLLVIVFSRVYVNGRRRKRREAFADQLVGTLEVICSALRAGHSFPSALDSVAADAASPTDEEFARIVNAGRLGKDAVDAMHETARRMENEDFAWVADGVAIQRDTGGNLSEVLERVGQTIRERNELHKKVRAISAEGRLSGWVMMAVPPLVGGYLTALNPKMFKSAFLSPTGIMLLGACIVLYLIGFFWIRKIVKVTV
ncbi:MAG: type II secretion system F family protein [Aeromicrobium sp.]